MAKIEAGKLALTFEPVDLEATAEVAFDSIRSLVKEGVQLIWAVQSNLPPIEADQIRLRQILTNLLSNSAKFTHEGYIRLEIFAEDEEKVHIAVRDSGIGIASEEFEVLFRAFEQIDNSTTRQEGGTGLGLPITKWLVTMHEGHIWVESTKNQGSAFHVILPWQRTQELPPPTFAESLLTE
jgi:signal transduction histidine kinase